MQRIIDKIIAVSGSISGGLNISQIDIWSGEQALMEIDSSVGDQVFTPTIVTPAYIHARTIKAVHVLLKIRKVQDSSGSTNNQLTADCNIQVRKGAGAFTTGHVIKDNEWNVYWASGQGESVGIFIIGSVDLSAIFTATDTYSCQLNGVDSEQSSLQLIDIQWGLRFILA